MGRHNQDAWIHVARKCDGKIITRKIDTSTKNEVYIQLYTARDKTLSNDLPDNKKLEIIQCDGIDDMQIAQYASQRLLEQADNYDMVGYMEDDIIIEDGEFFDKVRVMQEDLPLNYTVIPHRCEIMRDRGEVILSGDPIGGRSDLFWDTGEKISVRWRDNSKVLYRATNPHSGCFFLSRKQAIMVKEYWEKREWKSPYMLSGPLEHAASGRLIEIIKIMKPIPENYRFFKVIHCDELWKRHEFEY